jgi:hypothetical protein
LLELVAQSVDVAVDGARWAGRLRVVRPHLAGQLGVGERPARLARERCEEIELKPRELDRQLVHVGGSGVAVDGQSSRIWWCNGLSSSARV